MNDLEFWTYIVTNGRNGTLYTGHTDNIGLRLEQHIHGDFTGFTAKHGLHHLVWRERHDSRDDAFTRERRIKKWKRTWKLRLIETENPMWIDLHTVPIWPLPDSKLHPETYLQCLQHRLDIGPRRGERDIGGVTDRRAIP